MQCSAMDSGKDFADVQKLDRDAGWSLRLPGVSYIIWASGLRFRRVRAHIPNPAPLGLNDVDVH